MLRGIFIVISGLTALFHLSCSGEKTSKQQVAGNIGTSADSSNIQFEQLPASQTGIDFNNSFTDEGRTNVFIWHFIYNGAGVAIGDINNDGLPDIYFCGNRVPDRLYLNTGNFQFQDISVNAGIQTRGWSTGVTMADVNADGLLDIYVCKNSPTADYNQNRNKLFINKGDLTFSEQSRQYGIDDPGFSVQATFFDADQDGDLDMYLANQPFDAFARLVNQPNLVEAYPATNCFYFFEKGKYIDRTESMGMADARYSLNVSLGDFDLNGWTDIYVCNDYYHADQLYMNTGGTFVDALKDRTQHISFYSMGSDVADINNDGWLDIVVLDMAFEDHYRSKTNMGSMDPERFWGLVNSGQHYQYAQNTMQLNAGHGYFTDVAQLSGIHKSDWSYAGLFADLEHDGDPDLLITNGVVRDMQNNDFNAYVKERYQGQVGPQNLNDVLEKLPSNPVPNALYRNDGNLRFSKISEEAGFDFKGFSNGLACGDLDGDGMTDLVVNNLMAQASIYKNASSPSGNYLRVRLKGPGKNSNGLGITALLIANGQKQIRTMQTTRGYFSSCEPVLDFGLGNAKGVDSLIIFWNSREMSVHTGLEINREVMFDYEKVSKQKFRLPDGDQIPWKTSAGPDHTHREQSYDDYADQVLLPYKLSQNGPFIASADVNGDGSEDLFISGAAGFPSMTYLKIPNGGWSPSVPAAFESDRGHEDQEAVFFDLENDGDQDLLVASGSNEFSGKGTATGIRLYLNDGRGTFNRAGKDLSPIIAVNGQAVEVFDIEGDGDMDVFVGGRLIGGQYPVPASSHLLINHNGRLTEGTSERADFLSDFGLVTDAVAADVDGDGDQDLMVAGEWMSPTLLINDGKGYFTQRTLDDPGAGLWWAVASTDVDNDGDMDFLLGNLGWNNKFGGAKGTKLEVYASDFDRNGDFDVVLAQQKDGKTLPVRGRECSSEEMPFVWEKFPSFDSYGKAKLDDIIPPELLSESTHGKLKTMSSVLLMNDGEGGFTSMELPVTCQQGPIKAFQVLDLNDDGKEDFVYAGNHYPTEVETARYDGLFPGYCISDGKGGFDCYTIFVDGKPVKGDFRDIEMVTIKGVGKLFFFANNDGPVVSLVIESSNSSK